MALNQGGSSVGKSIIGGGRIPLSSGWFSFRPENRARLFTCSGQKERKKERERERERCIPESAWRPHTALSHLNLNSYPKFEGQCVARKVRGECVGQKVVWVWEGAWGLMCRTEHWFECKFISHNVLIKWF